MKMKIAAAAWIAVWSTAFFSITASAYIDPSVVAYTVQAVAGVAIAAGAVFFVWWRKVRKKVSKKLGIDENAGKEVEEDLIINDAEDQSEKTQETAENKEDKVQ